MNNRKRARPFARSKKRGRSVPKHTPSPTARATLELADKAHVRRHAKLERRREQWAGNRTPIDQASDEYHFTATPSALLKRQNAYDVPKTTKRRKTYAGEGDHAPHAPEVPAALRYGWAAGPLTS